jgi:rhomboid protease GluP
MSAAHPPDEPVELPREGASGPEASAPPAASEPQESTRFPYGRTGTIELSASGFRAPRRPGRGEAFVAYRDVTHVAFEPRALAIGTRHGVLLLSRAALGGTQSAEALAGALRARIFALPHGDAYRARFERLDAKLGMRWPWIAAALVAGTGVAYALQQLVPGFYDAAIYRPSLLAIGEWWRYAATQFLHVNFVHLAVNAAAALVAGAFVERSLGRMGTLFVAGLAGAGAMIASRFGNYGELLGFSGVAAGFFGALVALEFLAPAELPAPARIPRSVLIGVIALQVALDAVPQVLPAWATHTAGLAHLGGFVGGALAALVVRESTRGLVVAGALAAGLVTAASFAMVARNLAAPAAALERQARAMLSQEGANPGELNNLAWEIATSRAPSRDALAAAAELAERAVARTGGEEPTVLDTLAEVYFAQGRAEDAVRIIDRAIALAPGESYYVEQRRRFTGERAADDRPAPPAESVAPGAGDREEEAAPPEEPNLPPGDEVTV